MRNQNKQPLFAYFENGCMHIGYRGTHRVTKTRKLQSLRRNIGLTVIWMHPQRKGRFVY